MRRCQRSVQLIVFAAAAGLVLALTAYKTEQNAMRRARFRERDLKERAALELGEGATKRVQMALTATLTLDEFAEAFGAPAELTELTDPRYAGMTHFLFHERSQRTFYLRFLNGQLVGFQSSQGNGDVDTGVVLESRAFRRSESVRTAVLSGGLIAWCVVLIAGICRRRFRRRAAVWLVTTSMVCGLCWFLAPNYSPTVGGAASNDNLAIFVFGRRGVRPRSCGPDVL